MKPTLVVMAAGMGSRYGGLKQIDPVGPSGEIVIDYSVFDAVRAGFGRVVFIIRRDIEEAFRAVSREHFEPHCPVDYVFQELDKLPPGFQAPPDRKKPWGTGHAILCCRDAVHEPFAVINADDFYGRRSFAALAGYLTTLDPAAAQGTLVAFVLRNTLSENGAVTRALCKANAQGDLVDIAEVFKIEKDGHAARSIEADGRITPLTAEEPVSMNMWGFTPAIFESLAAHFAAFLPGATANPKAEFLIPTVVGSLIKGGELRMKMLSSTEKWLGVTYPEDKPIVAAGIKAMVDAGTYTSPLW